MVRSRSLMVVIVLSIAVTAAGCSTAGKFTKSSVTICEKPLVVPTYQIGKPDPNPRFYEGRAYQGAQGRVYPYPMLDRLTEKRKDKTYKAVYLENEYIRICVLPEIGGRVFEAVDKTNGLDFLYRQHVIKPGLIGVIGAWISGGIEWNFPHHHRASVFLPMKYLLKDNPDGSKTLWMSEIEIRHRMRLVIGITLRPGKSYFEAEIRPYNRSLVTNAWHMKALNLKAAVLRRLGRPKKAAELANKVSDADPLNLWSLHEAYMAGVAMGLDKERIAEMRGSLMPQWKGKVLAWFEAQPYLEIAVDYANAGLWDEAIKMLSISASPCNEKRKFNDLRRIPSPTRIIYSYPMVHYYLGYFWEKKGNHEKVYGCYRDGSICPPDYCFPFRAESIHVLRAAFRNNPKDGRAHYYLGNLLYDRQPEKAIKEWEKALKLDPGIATLHRNLARGYFQVEHNVAKAIASMEKAIECDKDPGFFYELDVLYEAGGVSPQKRLDLLTKNHKHIRDHNDAFSREIVLLTRLGYYDKTIKMMMPPNHFRRWEGLGNIQTTYVNAHLLRARKYIKAGQYSEAVEDYEAALEYPDNLEVARPHHGGRDCEIYCLLGNVYDEWSNTEKAKEFYEKAATAKRHERRSALDFYQGTAYKKLGREDKAGEMFDALIKHGKEKLESLKAGTTLEFFAKFGKKRSVKDQKAEALYLMGLGFIGKGDVEAAKKKLGEALKLNPNHLWAKTHLEDLE